MNSRIMKVGCVSLLTALAFVAVPSADDEQPRGPFEHVLLISIDGLHAQDLDWYLQSPPDGSALAWLSANGRTYTNASATKPSDSFPGMLAMVTGGTPRSTGVYYDDGWDRTVVASNVSCSQRPLGARVQWKQNLDKAGSAPFLTVIDDTKLPQDPADCSRIRPHQFPRVNNVFEIIKAAGGRTAWSDKHPAYEYLNGPSGTGIDDLYAPEIASCDGVLVGAVIPNSATICTSALVTTNYFAKTIAYDNMKVEAIINEIDGYDHARAGQVGVPTVFGMNFQAVSVGQKLDMTTMADCTGGYLSDGTPCKGGYQPDGMPSVALQQALAATDASLGRMISELRNQDLLDSTLIIVSAKHGNSPVDPTKLSRLSTAGITSIVNSVAPGLAQLSADTGPLIWLKDGTKAEAVADALKAAPSSVTGIDPTAPGGGVLWGAALADQFADPSTDARAPDLILFPTPGTVYGAGPTKIADHGSFYSDDVHVALLVSNSRLEQLTIDEPVETRQIACTILRALGQECDALQSQAIEPSMCLPPMGWAFGHAK